MSLNGKLVLFSQDNPKVSIIDVATGKVFKRHDVEGKINGSASVQRNIAAIAVQEPHHGAHVMDVKSEKVVGKFIIPRGHTARVALSKDTLALAVGSSTGLSG